MREQDLQIHLRRRHIEQSQRRRPRVPGRLRQLGATGPVLPPLPAHSREAFVQVRVTHTHTTRPFLRYLERQKGVARQDAPLFGPGAAARQRFVQAAQQDHHQFRLVVEARDMGAVDRTQMIELFMAQVERDLGRPLDWLAAHHDHSAHLHTHLVLRGRDLHGKDLYMEKDYFTFGLRARAAQIMTWLLGPQRQQQQFIQSDRLIQDGVLRGQDDPDIRVRVWQQPAILDAMRTPAEVLAPYRDQAVTREMAARAASQAQVRPVPLAEAGAVLARMAASLTALRQVSEAQQHRQRGHGMGW